jgi:hypothetical protein
MLSLLYEICGVKYWLCKLVCMGSGGVPTSQSGGGGRRCHFDTNIVNFTLFTEIKYFASRQGILNPSQQTPQRFGANRLPLT